MLPRACKDSSRRRNGNKVTVDRKVYPGYVLVEMVVGEETMHTIGAIQGAIKFVGKDRHPQPLRDDEVKRLLGIAVEEEVAAPKEEIPFLPRRPGGGDHGRTVHGFQWNG